MIADRRAQRLLRCYPRAWRDRYGDEFSTLLVDDLAERPHCWRRDLDVVRAGLLARLSACGLASGPVRDRSSVKAVAATALVFFAAGALSIWTQLADGWLSTQPHTRVVTGSLVALSVSLAGLLVMSAMVGLRMVAGCVRTCREGAGRMLFQPLWTLAASCGVLVVGLHIIAATAPGARGPQRDGVLAHAAAIGWAATQSISTFWLHPHRLVSLPASHLAWMAICPAAVAAAGWALLRLERVVGRMPARRDWPASTVANGLLVPCLTGAAIWVIGSQHAANPNYRAGTLDLLLVAVMATASLTVRRAATATA